MSDRAPLTDQPEESLDAKYRDATYLGTDPADEVEVQDLGFIVEDHDDRRIHLTGGWQRIDLVDTDEPLETGRSEPIPGAEEVRAYLGDAVEYAVQSEPLGTGHAVMQARPLVGDGEGDGGDEDEGEDAAGDQSRSGEWEDDAEKSLDAACPIDHGRLFEGQGNAEEERSEHPHAEGQGEGHIGQD